MPEPARRVLIVAFDALRPDMVTPELMPNLCAFAAAGVRFSHSRATFPTETRVNQAALVTGCTPARHGIVGNKFMDPVASPGKLFNTGDETELAAGDRRLGGRLLDVPALGEILAEHGMSLATISAGTPGGARLLHHKAEPLGGFRFALHRPDASVPAARIADLIARIGPVPPHQIPSLSWLTYATDAYLDYVEPELAPEVAILWLCEPDNSYHYRGIGSAENLAAMRHADAEFGRILTRGDHLQIITLSDHGQLTVAGAALELGVQLTEAGFTVGEMPGDGAELALALGGSVGITLRDPARVDPVVAWLQAQPWCGPLFTRDGRGCLTHAQVGLDHPRAPDIALVLRADEAPNAHGVAGSCRHDSHYPEGGGIHGGLHPIELATWFAAQGDAFVSGRVSSLPTGIVDVLPTVLHLLGLEAPPWVQGRVLREALAAHAGEPPPAATERVVSAESNAGPRAHLSLSTVAGTCYLNRAWLE
ncbi:MAG: alkaline phosphatase family protein [Proteobacteria bacterium]|nr:alkaline phosphatase family protein [Pseudomonadota bacterium]